MQFIEYNLNSESHTANMFVIVGIESTSVTYRTFNADSLMSS